ncbi:hypothetical protein ACA910_002875 [Epithemia clementina (nom. ined.)]
MPNSSSTPHPLNHNSSSPSSDSGGAIFQEPLLQSGSAKVEDVHSNHNRNISLGGGGHEDGGGGGTATDESLLSSSLSSLQDRILDIIEKCPNRTIRPARLAAEVGDLSVEDATAELCHVMAAVGSGATFFFEKNTATGDGSKTWRDPNDNRRQVEASEKQQQATVAAPPVMVFTFPPDFRVRAQRARRVQDWKEQLAALGLWMYKVVQIIMAFGLILSLLILAVAAMLAFVAALIAMQRAGGSHQRNSNNHHGGGGLLLSHHHRIMIMRQMQHFCWSIRDLLWCYAMFGPDLHYDDNENNDGRRRDPFLRELAYDLALMSSVCCGRSGSLIYWWRVRQLSQRRHRILRGWRSEHDYAIPEASANINNNNNNNNNNRRIYNGDLLSSQELEQQQQSQEYRGILSVAVEFLFGPSNTQHLQQRELQRKWKLRAAFLVRQSMANKATENKDGVSLEQLCPYTDDPPTPPPPSVEQDRKDQMNLATQGLLIVSHFHGIPLFHATTTTTSKNELNDNREHDVLKSRFLFPELVSESVIALRYDDGPRHQNESRVGGALAWSSFLYNDSPEQPQLQLLTSTAANRSNISNSNRDDMESDFPSYYHEPEWCFTNLSKPQFISCVVLGVLNFVGVLWFRQATGIDGVMEEVVEFRALARLLRHSLVPVLWFYARLFWLLALSRFCYNLLCNQRIRKRNHNRCSWATSSSATT